MLILLATDDHKYWTSVGYGLEAILPDGKVGGFGREAVPLLKNGDYAAAVTLLTTRVATVIAQDAGVTLENQPRVAEAPQKRAPSGGSGGVVVVVIILFVVFSILRAIFRGGTGTSNLRRSMAVQPPPTRSCSPLVVIWAGRSQPPT